MIPEVLGPFWAHWLLFGVSDNAAREQAPYVDVQQVVGITEQGGSPWKKPRAPCVVGASQNIDVEYSRFGLGRFERRRCRRRCPFLREIEEGFAPRLADYPELRWPGLFRKAKVGAGQQRFDFGHIFHVLKPERVVGGCVDHQRRRIAAPPEDL